MKKSSTAMQPGNNPGVMPSRQAERCCVLYRIGVSPVLIAATVLWTFAASCPAQPATGNSQSALANPGMFQGARYDAETGFYYFRNRYYDPQAGRFLQRDPVWDASNAGGSYNFVANNPANWADPSGEFVVVLVAAAALGVAIVGATLAASPTEKEVQQTTAARKQLEVAERQREVDLRARAAARVAEARRATLGRPAPIPPPPARCSPASDGASVRGPLSSHEQEMARAYAWVHGGALDHYQRLLNAGQASLAAMPGVGGASVGRGPLPARASPRTYSGIPMYHRPALGNPSVANFRAYEKAVVAARMRTSIANDIANQRAEWMKAVRELECQKIFTSQEADWIYRNIDNYIGESLNRDIYLSNFGRQVLRPHPSLGIPRGNEPGQGSIRGGDLSSLPTIRMDAPTTGTGTEIIER